MKFFKDFVSSVVASLVASFIYAWLTAGPTSVVGSALVALFSVLGGICGLAISIIYQRYVGVLGAGAKPKGSLERQAYEKLRESIAKDGSATRLYIRRLTGFLDAVDHLFGDAGMANRTLFPRAFGLRTPASLRTAPALDRCLLLALIYPVATIFVIWAVTGHVGPAEAALHLKPTLSGWQRSIGVALVGFSTFAWWHFFRKSPWKFSWILVAFVSGVIAVAIAGTVTMLSLLLSLSLVLSPSCSLTH